MERILLSIIVVAIMVQYIGYFLLRIDIRRIGYTDQKIKQLPTLTARLPLIGVVVPFWYLYRRGSLKKKENDC